MQREHWTGYVFKAVGKLFQPSEREKKKNSDKPAAEVYKVGFCGFFGGIFLSNSYFHKIWPLLLICIVLAPEVLNNLSLLLLHK